jgi:hypothetical protein
VTDGTWADGVERFQAVQQPTVTHVASSVVFVGGTGSYVAEPPDHCQQCGQHILIMINRGQGYCSEQCRKALADE